MKYFYEMSNYFDLVEYLITFLPAGIYGDESAPPIQISSQDQHFQPRGNKRMFHCCYFI
jgi:hypothetical protein